MPLRNHYLFAPFISGIDQQSDILQMNQHIDGRLNFSLRELENMEFESLGKLNNKPFDVDLVSGSFSEATSLESDGKRIFRVDRNRLHEYNKDLKRFQLRGSSVASQIDQYFVTANVDRMSYEVCNGLHYVANEFEGNIKLTVMDQFFRKISFRNMRKGDSEIRIKPYVFCLGDEVFVACLSGSVLFVYTVHGSIRYQWNFTPDIRVVKAHENFLIVVLSDNSFYIMDWVAGNIPVQIAKPENYNYEHFDFHYDNENETLNIVAIENSPAIAKAWRIDLTMLNGLDYSLYLNEAFIKLDEDDQTITEVSETVLRGLEGEVDLSSDNRDIIMFRDDSFMMKFSDGTLIKDGDRFLKLFNFDPYYMLSEERFVVYNEYGYFIMNFDREILGKFGSSRTPLNKDLFQRGFRYVENNIVPSIQANRLTGERGEITEHDSGVLCALDDDIFSHVDIVRVKDTLFFSGSLISTFDGEIITNTSFNQRPVAVLSTSPSLETSDPVFRITAIYSWIDGNGNIYRSTDAPRVNFHFNNTPVQEIDPISGSPVVNDDGDPIFVDGGARYVEVKVTNLNLTNKSNVFIELYRTEPNETKTFYKAASILNDRNKPSTTFRIDLTQKVEGNEILYNSRNTSDDTDGDAEKNIQPEGARFLTIYNSRVYAMRTNNDRNKVSISKPLTEFGIDGLEFSGQLALFLPDDITSYEVMDDKLIIFTSNEIYYYRDGFSEPEPVVGNINVGCSDIGASVLGKDGIYFKSKKGLYMLNRGLSLSFVGYHAQVSLDDRIVKCINAPSDNELYFLNESGDVIVYNTFFKNFSLRRSKRFIDLTADADEIYMMDEERKIFREDRVSGKNLEDFKIETGWIQLRDTLGRQRVREIFLMGDIDQIESLRLTLSYDFKEGDISVRTLTKEEINRSKVFEGRSIFEGPEIFGLTDGQVMYRFFPDRQECVSLRVRIEVLSQRGFSLSGIGFKYGIKGPTRIRAIKGGL